MSLKRHIHNQKQVFHGLEASCASTLKSLYKLVIPTLFTSFDDPQSLKVQVNVVRFIPNPLWLYRAKNDNASQVKDLTVWQNKILITILLKNMHLFNSYGIRRSLIRLIVIGIMKDLRIKGFLTQKVGEPQLSASQCLWLRCQISNKCWWNERLLPGNKDYTWAFNLRQLPNCSSESLLRDKLNEEMIESSLRMYESTKFDGTSSSTATIQHRNLFNLEQ